MTAPTRVVTAPHELPALLVLEDGTAFRGSSIGAHGTVTGEAVFNTGMAGYQEVLTDPSYRRQIVAMTAPHIGNYGLNAADMESDRIQVAGYVVKEAARRPSSWRAEQDLRTALTEAGVVGLEGIDTRRLTRHLRDEGSAPGAFGTADHGTLLAAARAEPGTDGVDLVATVSTDAPYTVGDGPRRVVAYDFGIKTTILRHLGRIATVEVVPASTPYSEVLARQPDGVFLSNGPGDPAAVAGATDNIRGLLGEVPVFGICLGHQLLASALGAETYKLKFGHHGGNHPVQRVSTGTVEITSQNHNFAVAEGSLDACDITHVNLNDGVIEGFACRDIPAFGIQYHPEAGPGPHDAEYLFDDFEALMDKVRSSTRAS
jgi:carbamoyl-phosphate synthase small subunit